MLYITALVGIGWLGIVLSFKFPSMIHMYGILPLIYFRMCIPTPWTLGKYQGTLLLFTLYYLGYVNFARPLLRYTMQAIPLSSRGYKLFIGASPICGSKYIFSPSGLIFSNQCFFLNPFYRYLPGVQDT